MVELRHTQLKQDLAQLKEPSIMYHRLPDSATTTGWIQEIKARVEELKSLGFTCMGKQEYQTLLLQNSLPKTSTWREFRENYPIQDRWGRWTTGFYRDDKWILTLDVMQELLHLHLFHTRLRERRRTRRTSDRTIWGPGAPWRRPGRAPPAVEVETSDESGPEKREGSIQSDNFTPRTTSFSPNLNYESSASSMRSTLTSRKRRG